MTTPPPGQPGQPGAPGNPFGPQGQPIPQQPGQPVYGQPGQPVYGQPAPGQPGGFAPVAGGSNYPAPQPARSNKLKPLLITGGVIIVAIIAIAVGASTLIGDKDSGTTVDSSPVGSCITVEGSLNVTTEAVDCSATGEPSFIVGAKLESSEACTAAEYSFSVTEYGSGASDQVLCLIPNYELGECYTSSKSQIGIKLETVSCSTESSMFTANFKVTERSESGSVPNCDGATRLAETFEIRSDPARQISFCSEIIGEGYTWK